MKMEMKEKESYEKPSVTVVQTEMPDVIMASPSIEGGAIIDGQKPGQDLGGDGSWDDDANSLSFRGRGF